MNDVEQARAYSEADFHEPHQAFVDMFRARFRQFADRPFRAVDLGCGAADVTVRFARAHSWATVVGVDGADAMLEHGRARIAAAGLEERIELMTRRLPDPGVCAMKFDVAFSNSLLHHINDPQVLWDTISQCTVEDGAVFVMDLCRPSDDRAVEQLVDTYARDEPPVLKRDFRASLRAAYRPDEVRGQLASADLRLAVEQVTDRHIVAWGSR